ncbi:superoxide dismutase [Patescibacteria group bacterium]
MQKYKEKQFNIPDLQGISQEQINEHLKLYNGYVKHTNLIREKIAELKEGLNNEYLVTELRRRFAFEFNGMRMHELYFECLEGKAKELAVGSKLRDLLADKYGSFEEAINHFKEVVLSRGIGWTILYYDPVANTPHITWVSDHELGQLAGLPILLALDMWEHAFMVDYLPSEKKNYIEAFFPNLNWEVVEERLKNIKT